MRQKLIGFVLAVAAAMQVAKADAELAYPPQLKPAVKEAKAARLAAELLSRYHYKAVPLDDALSDKVFEVSFETKKFILLNRWIQLTALMKLRLV